jgi:hypothetical protein
MSIQGEIDRLSAAKTAIASALETMGIEPPEGTTLDQYAAQLTAIAASAPWLDKSTYDPQNKAQDVFGYVDSVAEGLIEYVDFTVTEEPLNGGYRAISNKTFDEVVALLKAGKTVIGRIVQTAGDKFYYSALTVSNAMDMGEGSVKQICFSSYFDDSIKSNSTTIIMEQTYTTATQCGSLHIPTPDDTADNGKVLMASNSEGVWSPVPTAGELGALPISGGTMTGPLTLSGDPAEDLQAAPKQYVDNAAAAALPSGCILLWSGAKDAIPDGFVLCDGQNNTPDLRSKFVLGAGSTYAVGATGGEATHTLTVNEMPSHTHDIYGGEFSGDPTHNSVRAGYIGEDNSVAESGVITNTGGGQPHNNMPPYYALCYIMKV